MPGPKSLDDLKAVDGQLCETYREACQRRGVLESDSHWMNTIEEAASSQMPQQLRQLFAIIVSTCAPSNPCGLYETFRDAMAEDILLQARRKNLHDDLLGFSDEIFNELLQLLDDAVPSMTGKSASYFGLPPFVCSGATGVCKELQREESYDKSALATYVATNERLLVPDQKTIYDQCSAVLWWHYVNSHLCTA